MLHEDLDTTSHWKYTYLQGSFTIFSLQRIFPQRISLLGMHPTKSRNRAKGYSSPVPSNLTYLKVSLIGEDGSCLVVSTTRLQNSRVETEMSREQTSIILRILN